ncbi:hypothetical protein VPNG_09716 [Cytospora leucostoma]|uniref:USP domain-containing protein n=1 Tax=Cytospora leucostoma TaxID=1230097 RepID=A0A423VKP9_9PEZI|nr:hypothetical protein VPNG_09716 [Cytospora leucostoma]
MEDIKTLEDVRSYVRRKNLGKPALCRLLLRFWPHSAGEDPSNMSAMDCLVMVIRHVYCHLVPEDALDETIDANELLTFAFLNLGADTSAGLEKMQEARERMFGVIKKDWRLGKSPGFADLIESEPMLESIWSFEPFRLFHPILHKGLEAHIWELIADERKQALFEARESLVVWDTEKHERLEDAVANKFGIFEGRRWRFFQGTVEMAKFSRTSLVMRVNFLPRKRLENFDINTIREIKAPAHVPHYETKLDTESAPESKPVEYRDDDKGPGSYLLMAVVRLRDSESEFDSVRLYDVYGNNIVPNADAEESAGFVDDSWLLEHQDSSYMLFYFHNDGDTCHRVQDEVGRRRADELHSQSGSPSLPDAEALDDEEPVGEEDPVNADDGKEMASSEGRKRLPRLGRRKSSQMLAGTSNSK